MAVCCPRCKSDATQTLALHYQCLACGKTWIPKEGESG